MKYKLSRRNFLKATGATSLGAVTGGVGGLGISAAASAMAAMPSGKTGKKAELPKVKGPRVVVVGGGWSGLTAAKYLKKENPKFDVVLIERRATFMSCPMSNLWLADAVDLEFLEHSFLDAAKNNNYTFFNATVIDVDRGSRKIYTEQGYVGYDYLVLAPGIDYDYSRVGVTDIDDIYELKTKYPAGFIPGSEHLSIKNKLSYFEGGVFLLTTPSGNYRCLPGPYERTCMVASIFKREKIKGKVLLLDANPDITIKKEGFHKAFDTLYEGIVEYKPSSEIKSVDVAKKEVKTEVETYKFDDAALYPGVRASRMIEDLGLANPESPQKEANIDVFKYNVKGDDRVYVAGDARPMPFSKSGNTANSEAKFVARVIAARAAGKEIDWESPNTICYSAVATNPIQSISVDAHYKYDPKEKSFAFDRVKMYEEWSKASGQANLEWARGLYRDIFS
jgi:sulfide dehydrogenase [flavocytochrome c] flavoprotein subunit